MSRRPPPCEPGPPLPPPAPVPDLDATFGAVEAMVRREERETARPPAPKPLDIVRSDG